ncbi:MAG: 23S rRNA (guanosine(2251)-2'-O)-methyltransferase RlmB [Dehalococcoidales bacterium]|nr:23S rRNA (guanosine(2251)-2'-O)-methyltransferase RlmB [Dehalococcoidales bacterium]
MTDTIEGRNPVLEALRAERPIRKILLARNLERHSAIAEILHLARSSNVTVEYADRQVIDRQSVSTAHQGVLAFTLAKEYSSLDDLLDIARIKNEPAFLILLDGIEDPHNLGAVIRTADAAGAHGIIIREKRAVGLTPVVEKAASGALEYVPVARVTNLSRAIEALKKENIWVVGIDQSADVEYTRIDYTTAVAIVTGGEGKGISQLVKQHCDFLARIPMKGKISSLNASVAAAVVMYEILKQRSSH